VTLVCFVELVPDDTQQAGENRLLEQIQDLELSPEEATILARFAKDVNGWRVKEAAGILAERTKLGKDACHTAIVGLLASDLLKRSGDGADSPIAFNWARFEITEEQREEIQSTEPAFKPYGSPLSAPARNSLEQLYRTYPEGGPKRLYLALGATPPERFEGLENRAQPGQETILLMPREKDLKPFESSTLYDEVVEAWRKWLAEGERSQYVEMRFTYRSSWAIHGSALTEDLARFTVHRRREKPNQGELIEAARETSLYAVVHGGYRDAMRFSLPWKRFYKRYFARDLMGWTLPPLVLALAILITILIPSRVVGLVAGTAITFVATAGVIDRWTKGPKLFDG